ncbi:DUF6868 family protein [Methylogaea oryzae]
MLGWCAVLNLGLLLCWFLLFLLAHDRLYRLHARWFQLGEAQFDAIHYGGMAAYKIAILLFNLTPYLALRIAG